MTRCPNGTRRNKKTGRCEAKKEKTKKKEETAKKEKSQKKICKSDTILNRLWYFYKMCV